MPAREPRTSLAQALYYTQLREAKESYMARKKKQQQLHVSASQSARDALRKQVGNSAES